MNVGWGNSFAPLAHHLGFVVNFLSRKSFLLWLDNFWATLVHLLWICIHVPSLPCRTGCNTLGVDWDELNLQILIEILHHAKDAAKNDVQANRLQPQYILRGLRWLAKTALVEHLNNSLVSSFLKGSGAPKDRREAVPIPLLILILWEEALKKSSTPTWIRLLLGGFLLATWGSLRFADLQRIELSSLNVADNSLRGTCRMTKTTRSGQPFAVLLAGFSADSAQSSWVFHWLRTLHQAAARHPQFAPDFMIPTMDSLHCPSLTAPLSYAAALRAIRWACQTPWDHPRMSSQSAQNITLHSLKVTMLSSAAQLRLPHRDRQIQGHHTGGSVQLYSRDDTVDALWVQTQISTSVRQGWRPVRPQHRGGQAPMHEMPVTISLRTDGKLFRSKWPSQLLPCVDSGTSRYTCQQTVHHWRCFLDNSLWSYIEKIS